MLSLLNVYDVPLLPPANAFTTRYQTMSSIAEEMRRAALDKLKKIIDNNGLSDFKQRCIVRNGGIEEQILNVIEDNAIHLVIMGTKGTTAERGLFMGSITKGIAQHASCPVLAIPEKSNFGEISKIVYATDLQSDETSIVSYIIKLASLYDASLIVMHVDHDKSRREWSIGALKNIVDKSGYPKITYKEMVLNDVSKGINDFVLEQKASMLAMTTHTTSLFDKIFHDSLTQKLLLHTNIPLLAFNKKKYDTIFLG